MPKGGGLTMDELLERGNKPQTEGEVMSRAEKIICDIRKELHFLFMKENLHHTMDDFRDKIMGTINPIIEQHLLDETEQDGEERSCDNCYFNDYGQDMIPCDTCYKCLGYKDNWQPKEK